jgi:ABC-type transporter Mla subunit MlaD
MRTHRAWLCVALLVGLTVAPRAACAPNYDSYLLDNLNRSRDALLSQQAELKRASNEVKEEIEKLNQRLTRIDQYLRQVDTALNDVEAAMRQAR